jgi:hypothetical protein
MTGWDEWLHTLPSEQQRKAIDLRDSFSTLGAAQPERWARSEVSEGIAHLPRFLLLRRSWQLIERWRAGEPEVARVAPELGARLEAAGISLGEVARLLAFVAFEAVFGVLHAVDEGYDPESSDELPGWRLVETGADERPTGRDVGGLHESLLQTDPRGIEGRDFIRR